MPRPAPASFATDLLRASLGPALAAPYERAFGAVPCLTAGTLAWPAAAAGEVLAAWRTWSAELPAHVLSAVRAGGCEVAVDVAVLGDPYGVPSLLAPLRALVPATDSAAPVGPRALRSPAAVESAAVALPAFPCVDELLDAPAGVCLGLRHSAAGPVLIGLAAAGERARAVAAIDQVARGLEEPVGA